MKRFLLLSLGLLNVLSVMQSYASDSGLTGAQKHFDKQTNLLRRISSSKSAKERQELQALLEADKAMEKAEIEASIAELRRIMDKMDAIPEAD